MLRTKLYNCTVPQCYNVTHHHHPPTSSSVRRHQNPPSRIADLQSLPHLTAISVQKGMHNMLQNCMPRMVRSYIQRAKNVGPSQSQQKYPRVGIRVQDDQGVEKRTWTLFCGTRGQKWQVHFHAIRLRCKGMMCATKRDMICSSKLCIACLVEERSKLQRVPTQDIDIS